MCCGIIGVLATDGGNVARAIRESLKRLEYRGYDSVGVATKYNGNLFIKKDKGKIDDIHRKLDLDTMPGKLGIGHTRWATHGEPSRVNSHPHTDCKNNIAVVHNGIIENFLELRAQLIDEGHRFRSQTDTEVIPHLIESFMEDEESLEEAVNSAVSKLTGAFAIVVLEVNSKKLVCARKESPLVLGIGETALYCASDIPAFLPMTNRVIFMNDGDFVVLQEEEVRISRIRGLGDSIQIRNPVIIDWTPEMAQKGGMPHFMLKEIHEQPKAVQNTLKIRSETIEPLIKLLNDAREICLTAAGTSYHACLYGSYLFTILTRINTHQVISSEFSEKIGETLQDDSVILAISQSGETSDTLRAIHHGKEYGAKIAAITNVVGSSITRTADHFIYTQAGPEIGVAATKTFLVQNAALALIGLSLAEVRGSLDTSEVKEMRNQLLKVPNQISQIIEKQEDYIKITADNLANQPNFLFLGRGINTTTAMEGALKLKEISYIHAEAYPAGESKHGPIALIDAGFPVVFIAPSDNTLDRIVGNIMEMKARGACIIGVTDNNKIHNLSDYTFWIPSDIPNVFTPIPAVVPLQLFSYYAAIHRNYNPDKPRNLAKSVTVL
ncbi:MAG: glutamine--fructose-6-phosphate transaminase (isomerizing) [Candidatus Helarchaeota archaeon]|nr:glutamine--fructose-6-phosphate transaminase (isomerizing) [Candidatus Helarchaeota archaeon]